MFNDGIITFYTVENTAGNGRKPEKKYTKYGFCGYDERTVGASRYAAALQHDVRLSLLVRTPCIFIDTSYVVTLEPYSHVEAGVFTVYQVQQVNENGLPMTDISLERLEGANADEIIGNS